MTEYDVEVSEEAPGDPAAPIEALRALGYSAESVFGVTSDRPERVRNIGAWCERLECWRRIGELDWHLLHALEAQSISTGTGSPATPLDSGSVALTTEESGARNGAILLDEAKRLGFR